MPTLNDPGLLRTQCLIDGAWTAAANGRETRVVNPATGAELARVPEAGAAEATAAVDAAARALPAWKALPAEARAQRLRDWFDLVLAHQEDLAQLMTAEQGKPLAEARGEIVYAASYLEWFAEEARRLYGDVVPSPWQDRRIVVTKEPIGVCAAITPWNFPAAMITRKVAPALAAGCTIVVKPAVQTPLTALALGELALRAGMPAGVLNVVTGDPEPIGAVLTSHPAVRKLSFTGSTRVGKLLAAQCAPTLKRLSLELGGNAPIIVFDDADVDAAVAGAIASKFRNSGQTCVCANRMLVQDGIHDRFAAKLAEAVAQLKVGDGAEPGVTQGPLVDAAALRKVQALVDEAVGQGATCVVGGRPHALGRSWFEPTVLTGVQPSMRLMQEEIFGPVAPLMRFGTEAEAIALANDTEVGLAAYFYSRDIARVWRVAEALEVGMVGVNTGLISTAVAPFGGVKQSGVGREGSRHGIESYVDTKYVCLGGL